jgi:hypothetical protein
MRTAQGVDDKEEARREIKRSIQVNTKVSMHPQTWYISIKHKSKVQVFFFTSENVEQRRDVAFDETRTLSKTKRRFSHKLQSI